MRLAASPIAWRCDVATAANMSGESSLSTHAAERPVDACRLMGAMLAALVNGESAKDVFAPGFWQWGDLHPQILAIAGGSYEFKAPPAIRGSGFCVDALEAAPRLLAAGRSRSRCMTPEDSRCSTCRFPFQTWEPSSSAATE